MTTEHGASRWDPQPAELAYAPPTYPGHGFTGTGTVWRVTVGEDYVGTLSYTDHPPAVVWQPDHTTNDWFVQEQQRSIFFALRAGAKDGTPLADVLAQLFGKHTVSITHDVELASLRP